MPAFTMTTLTEADVEQAALDWLQSSGWTVAHSVSTAERAFTQRR